MFGDEKELGISIELRFFVGFGGGRGGRRQRV